jgi:hypothetical protein
MVTSVYVADLRRVLRWVCPSPSGGVVFWIIAAVVAVVLLGLIRWSSSRDKARGRGPVDQAAGTRVKREHQSRGFSA